MPNKYCVEFREASNFSSVHAWTVSVDCNGVKVWEIRWYFISWPLGKGNCCIFATVAAAIAEAAAAIAEAVAFAEAAAAIAEAALKFVQLLLFELYCVHTSVMLIIIIIGLPFANIR